VAYVAAPTPTSAELAAMAEMRWLGVLAAHPDLEPAVVLQRALLAEIISLAEAIRRHPMPRLSLPPKYLAAKLSRGVPAFSGEPIPLPVARLTTSLGKLCDELAAGGAGDVATRIRAAVDDRSMDPGSLFTASLARNQTAIREGAFHRGLSPDLVWLVGELTVSPVAYALQRTLFATTADQTLGDALAQWHNGYCPACGSWPALAEVVDSHRTLRCSFCAAAWELPTYACVYCQEAGEPFVTAAPNEERKDRRVELCGACSGYLKAVDLPELSPFPLLAIADLETMDLDVAAMEHGFARPALREIKARA
jgi:FdhE protein